MSSDSLNNYFFEIYESLPRQGPGDSESTERALGFVPPLTATHKVIDIGCGSGAQTLDLARLCPAQIVAVDNHPPFVAQLNAQLDRLGLRDRVVVQVGDMADLPFPDGTFDLVWSEGAVFIMGFAQGLASWKRLLAPGGHLVLSEMCWLVDEPEPELLEFFASEEPNLATLSARREVVLRSGYQIVEEFLLPARGWWDNYYLPLSKSLEHFRSVYVGNAPALAMVERSQREIDIYRKYTGAFGYVFFVLRRA